MVINTICINNYVINNNCAKIIQNYRMKHTYARDSQSL